MEMACIDTIMVIYTMESGKMMRNPDLVTWDLLTSKFMKGNGWIIWCMGKENWLITTRIYMKDSLIKIRNMVEGYSRAWWLVLFRKGRGYTTFINKKNLLNDDLFFFLQLYIVIKLKSYENNNIYLLPPIDLADNIILSEGWYQESQPTIWFHKH